MCDLDLGQDPDIRDYPDTELKRLDQLLKDGQVHVEVADREEIEALPNSTNSLDPDNSKPQKRNRLPDRLRVTRTGGPAWTLHNSRATRPSMTQQTFLRRPKPFTEQSAHSGGSRMALRERHRRKGAQYGLRKSQRYGSNGILSDLRKASLRRLR